MKKTLFSIVLAMLLVLAAVPVMAATEGDIEADINDMYITRFVVENVDVDYDDETVQIDINVKYNVGFAGVTYLLEYDTEALTLEKEPVFGDIKGFSYEAGPLGDGGHIGMISCADNVYDTGTLLTYTFSINPEAKSGFYAVDFVTTGSVKTANGGTQELAVLDEHLVAVKSDSESGGIAIPGYTVNYNANGGSGAPDSQFKSRNDSITISDTVPERESYVFLGWATQSTATEATYKAGDKYSADADLTLYAVWKKVAGTIDVKVATVRAEPGEEVDVAISLENHPGFAGLGFDVKYDSTRLQYVSCEPKVIGPTYQYPESGEEIDGTFFAAIVSGTNVTKAGEYISVKFKVLDAAEEGLAEISVTPVEAFKYVNDLEEDLVPNAISGGVKIAGEVVGDINLDEKVNSDDAVLILKHFADGAEIEYSGSLDFNGDDLENSDDAVRLLRFVLFPDLFPIETDAAQVPETVKGAFAVGNVTGYTGEDVEVTVSLESIASFKAAGLADLTYDEDALEFEGFVVANDFGDLVLVNDASDATFVAASENEIASFNGVVLKALFTVKSDAEPGNYTVSVLPAMSDSAKFEAVSGTVEVKDISEKPNIPVTGISLNASEALLGIGEQVTLTATLNPVDASDKTVTWESSDTDVATVENGVVTAVSRGKAKITARTGNGKTATCTVNVGVRADKVNFTSLKFTSLAVGKSMSFKATAACEDGTKPFSAKVVYSIVEGREYAEIDEAKGKLTAIDFGEVVVRATAEFGTEKAYDEVTIKICVPATKVTLNTTKAAMAFGGGDLRLEAVMTAKEECTDTLTWESSDEEVAIVEEIEEGVAVVTALKDEGKVKITAITGSGKKATCSITIGKPATKVEFSTADNAALAVGKTLTLKAKAYREDGKNPVSANVVYEIISGKEYAELDAKGKLEGTGIGEVVVRATAEAGTEEAFDEITINVCIPATKVTLNKTKASMVVGGEDLELIAEMLPEENTDTLTWSVDKPEIATVEEIEDGRAIVTAHEAGKVKVTALTGSGKKATCSITIGFPADTVEFTTDDYTALAVGKILTLKAKASRNTDDEKPVSTNVVFEIVEGKEYAELDAKGKLKGTGIGEVVVRATAEVGTEEAFDEITINVCIPATKVTLNKTKAAMAYGEGDLVLVAEMLPLDNSDTLTWESSDEEIAVVEEIEEGVAVVTALKEEGKVKITAITGSGKKATCSVTIGLAADTVEFSSLKATSVAVGKTITLKAKASRNTDDEKPVSTNVEFEIIEGEEFAEIDAKGKLKGIEEGYVTVRAWAEAGTEDAYEDVVIKVCVPATKVTVYPTKAEMAVGEDMYLEAEMTSSAGDCTDDLFWSTSDEEIATVDEEGLVTAHSEGSVKITATSGSGKKATCTIKVVEAPEEPEEPEVPEEPDVPEGTFQEIVLHDLFCEFVEDQHIIEMNPGAVGGVEISATVVAPSSVKDVLVASWGADISNMSLSEIKETAEEYASMWEEDGVPIFDDMQVPFEISNVLPIMEHELNAPLQILLIGLDENYNAVGYYIVETGGFVVE